MIVVGTVLVVVATVGTVVVKTTVGTMVLIMITVGSVITVDTTVGSEGLTYGRHTYQDSEVGLGDLFQGTHHFPHWVSWSTQDHLYSGCFIYRDHNGTSLSPLLPTSVTLGKATLSLSESLSPCLW